MTQFLSAGVYTRVEDLSQYAPAQASSILALVGTAKKGPVNTPTVITNELDLLNTFGDPDPSSYLIYAGRQYLRNGRQLIVVRITDGTDATATIDIDGAAQPAFFIGGPDLSAGVDLSTRSFIRLAIDGAAAVDIDLLTGFAGSPTSVTLDHIVSAINALIPGIASKDNLSARVVLRSTTTGVASTITFEAAGIPSADATQIVFGVTETPLTVTGLAADSPALSISGTSPGVHANGIRAAISNGTNTGTFKIVVSDAQGAVLETYDNLTKETVEDTINGVSPNIVVDDEGSDNFPDPATLVGGTPPAAVSYTLSGGLDGVSTISDADFIGNPTTNTGLQSLNNRETVDFQLLAVPGISSGPVVLEMFNVCNRRGDCFALVDPPIGLTFTQAADYHNGAGTFDGLHPAYNTNIGAVYWPWVEEFDAINGVRVFTPPSGWVASQIALTDFVNDPWFAPAGFTRGRLLNGLRLETTPDLGQRDFLQSGGNAVNPIVDFSRDGITIFGQKTLQRTPSALDRVNVVRMLLYAKRLIADVSRILVFEPSDEILWRRATNLINPILQNIKDNRGLEDFSVVIDESTNPPEVRNQNEMRGKLFLIPTKTAEKIILDFTVLRSGAEFSDAA